jgi:hypothetical protein
MIVSEAVVEVSASGNARIFCSEKEHPQYSGTTAVAAFHIYAYIRHAQSRYLAICVR